MKPRPLAIKLFHEFNPSSGTSISVLSVLRAALGRHNRGSLGELLDRARLVCLDYSDEVIVCESSRCAHSRKVYQQAIVARIESWWALS
jgi:hypothetical protein